ENFKSKLAGYKERAKDRQHFVFGIFTKRTGEHIGAVDIYIINHEIKWGNLGYQIHNHHWGNGFATEASVITLKLSIKELGLHRVEAATEVRNYAARKVALKAGMVYEGRRKNFFENVDYVVFGANSLMMFPTREKMGSSKK
ncbi:MAG: GNAT family N-acetyltransferase, partial [Halobacteriovoraceae bacterium]|nr:GNAT family N-acetyltransferase [Halobacteriovoraceae bacterium]